MVLAWPAKGAVAVVLSSLFFFFQAEDGIRDKLVTGVQTCALPISPPLWRRASSRTSRPPAGARCRPRRQPGWSAAAARASRAGGAGGRSLRLGGLDRAVQDIRDVGALHDQARLPALHRDFVVLQMHDLADDPPRGDDAIAALQRREQLPVPLLLPALRADQHEVEDRDQGADLNQKDSHTAAGILTGGGEQDRKSVV